MALFDDDSASAQKSRLDRHPKAAGTGANDEDAGDGAGGLAAVFCKGCPFVDSVEQCAGFPGALQARAQL